MSDTIKILSLSRINVGNSNTDEKKYFLESKIELSNTFISMPFGTTRSRFQEREMFEYNLTLLNKNDNVYYYELMIKRNISLCNKSITSLFPEHGWNNLIISNIQKKKLNIEYILNNIPSEYGLIKHNLIPTNEYNIKIGIVIPCFGRYEYTKTFLDSLKLTNLNDCILIIVDESLTKDINEDKQKTHDLIDNYEIENIPIVKIFKNKHGNMNDSILLGMDILCNTCEYLMTIDSDTLIKTNWIYKTLETYNEVEKIFPNKKIIISGFNTDVHKITNEYDNFNLKETIGGCHLCFKSELYLEKLRFSLSSHKWDTNIYNIMNKNDDIIAVTKPSIVEHIGEISAVRNEANNVKSIDYLQDSI